MIEQSPQVSSAPLPTERRGLECPRCGCQHLPVVYTRRVSEKRIMRRRECRYCGRRITTYEESIG